MSIDLYLLPINQSSSERDDKHSREFSKLKKKKIELLGLLYILVP